jgi:hypothetical protein
MDACSSLIQAPCAHDGKVLRLATLKRWRARRALLKLVSPTRSRTLQKLNCEVTKTTKWHTKELLDPGMSGNAVRN